MDGNNAEQGFNPRNEWQRLVDEYRAGPRDREQMKSLITLDALLMIAEHLDSISCHLEAFSDTYCAESTPPDDDEEDTI